MLTDIVYSTLRNKILNLSLKPGESLNFNDLRKTYGVSNSPIRDALKRLESEGLVYIKPQSGSSVAKINLKLVEDERFKRLYLELGAIEQCFGIGMSKILIEKFEDLIEKQKEAFEVRDRELFLNLDDQMHRLIFEECGHEEVFDSLMATSGNYRRIRIVSYLFDEVFKCSLDQHVEILKALKDRDKERTIFIVRSHISRIENETFAYRNTYPQYFI